MPAEILGPIVVYQMGKVGSRSVFHSLNAMDLKTPIYHIHLLNHLDAIEASLRKAFKNPAMSIDAVEQGRALRAEIESQPERPWHLVSLVRDPVARNISRFFQGLDEVDPETRKRCEAGRVTCEELTEQLVTKWERNSSSQWFDTQVKDVFGIDVYARPFATDSGYDTYQQGRFSLLVLRLEDLDRCFRDAIRDFLGVERSWLRTINKADDKWYGKLYHQFMASVALPTDYLDDIYSSKFAQHFYSADELLQFRRRWTGENRIAKVA